MNQAQILSCHARQILDSRGNPTVSCTVTLSDGSAGVASVPSGASTGIYEAVEKRDGEKKRYGGKGVLNAVEAINAKIGKELMGLSCSEQREVDRILCALDGTDNKSRLGANATLAVSLAVARAAAESAGIPLYRYLGGINGTRLPIPMMNILNGGAHASNNVEIQEFMILPVGVSSFSEALRMGSEIYHTLGKLLRAEGHPTTVGDEGGYAPDLKTDEEALTLIMRAITESGYTQNEVMISLDCAAGEWYSKEGGYRTPKRGKHFTTDQLIDYWNSLSERFPILSIEDGLDQRDFDGWARLTDRIGNRVMLVGDDLFVTNEKRLRQGIAKGAANAILIKPNQIGTLSETVNVMRTAREHGYVFIPSHRSGETEDVTLADLAVALNAPLIKTGAPCRGERVCKYNRLLAIEEELGSNALYGPDAVSRFCRLSDRSKEVLAK